MVRVESAGSSPRMRGAPFKLKDIIFQGGIIPADAGSTTKNKDYE